MDGFNTFFHNFDTFIGISDSLLEFGIFFGSLFGEGDVFSFSGFNDSFGIGNGFVQSFNGWVQVFSQVIVGSGLIFDSVVDLLVEGVNGFFVFFGSGGEVVVSLLEFFG